MDSEIDISETDLNDGFPDITPVAIIGVERGIILLRIQPNYQLFGGRTIRYLGGTRVQSLLGADRFSDEYHAGGGGGGRDGLEFLLVTYLFYLCKKTILWAV